MCEHAASYLASEDDRVTECDNCGSDTCHWCYVIVTIEEGKYDDCGWCKKYGRDIHEITENICQDCLNSDRKKWEPYKWRTP